MKKINLLISICILANSVFGQGVSFETMPPLPPYPQHTYDFEAYARAPMKFIDIDNDGDEDLLIGGLKDVYANDYFTKTYINDGNGNFSVDETITFPGGGWGDIEVADIDNDGDKDLAISGILGSSGGGYATTLYANDGNGGFIKVTTASFVGGEESTVRFADIDNDNDLDFMITTDAGGFVDWTTRIYRNNGMWCFTEIPNAPFDQLESATFAFADIDNDNDQDILHMGVLNWTKVAHLYTNDGNGNFTLVPSQIQARSDGLIEFADVNNDNYQDVLVSGFLGPYMSNASILYLNDTNGNFTPTTNTFIATQGGFSTFYDADNDNDLDILIGGSNSGNVTGLYTNDGTGQFTYLPNPFEYSENGRMAYADIDNDNDQDLVIVGRTSYGESYTKLYTNNGTGNYQEAVKTPFTGIVRGAVAFSDVDNDNDLDIFITGETTNSTVFPKCSTELYINGGSGDFSLVTGTPFSHVYTSDLVFADVDNDNDQDVLLMGYTNSNSRRTKLYLNDGAGGFSQVTSPGFGNFYAGGIGFEDIDNDNDPDILITNSTGIYLYKNDGTGYFSLYPNSLGAGGEDFAFADIDNDLDADLVISIGTSNASMTTKLFTNDGLGNFTEVTGTPFADGREFDFADINGDNNIDLLISEKVNTTTSNLQPKLFTNDGTGTFTEVTTTTFVISANTANTFADVDNDNDLDLLTTGGNGFSSSIEPYSANLYINDGLGNFSLLPENPFQKTKDGAVAFGDVDGDNDQDVLIAGDNGSALPATFLYRNVTCFSATSIDNQTICDAITWIDGHTYDSDTTVSHILENAAASGCDSVATLNLNVLDSSTRIDSIYSASPYTWINGQTYSSSNNTASVTMVNAIGCDSLITLALTIPDSTATMPGSFHDYRIVSHLSVGFDSGDMDGDGDIDIINGTTWQKNLGNGKFSSPIVFTRSQNEVTSLGSGDMDGDGDLDVVVGSRDDDKIAWYENFGNGNFSAEQLILTTGEYTSSLHLGDLDNDGDLDILTCIPIDNKVIWFENFGNGAFSNENLISTLLDTPRSVYSSDFDGDGDEDVVSTLDQKIVWYENFGNGTFSSQNIITTNAINPRQVSAFDVDGDGDNDIIHSAYQGDRFNWHENIGSGNFVNQGLIGSWGFSGPYSFSHSDLDSDGDIDIVATFNDDQRIVIYENTGTTFSSNVVIHSTSNNNGNPYVHITDLNGDSNPDILTTFPYGYLVSYENLGAGNFGDYEYISPMSGIAQSIDYGDVDNDGDLDVISASGDSLELSENLGNEIFEIHYINTDYIDNDSNVKLRDIDNDGDLDIFCTSQSLAGWHENLGNNNFSPVNIIEMGYHNTFLDASDIDGDGDIDFLAGRRISISSTYRYQIRWYKNMGGTFANSIIITQDFNTNTGLALTSDLDNDGDLDILANTNGNLVWYNNLGFGNYSNKIIIPSNPFTVGSVFPADLDGDGDNDLLFGSYYDHIIGWHENLGNDNFSDPKILATNVLNVSCVVAEDMDNDGDLDVIYCSVADEKIAWLKNLGNNFFSNELVLSLKADNIRALIPVDFDLDSDMDVLLSHFSKIVWLENLQQNITDHDGDGIDNTTDCNDFDPTIYPNAPELCDGLDNNCNTVVDEGLIATYYLDVDGDGYGNLVDSITTCDSPPANYVLLGEDCDDNDNTIYPGATDLCDQVDNNCNGIVDEGQPVVTYYLDTDGDGFGNTTFTITTCATLPANYVLVGDDCDDNSNITYPGATEICDGLDNNCDGSIDEGLSASIYYLDADGDGYGNSVDSITTCDSPPANYVLLGEDCDDNNAGISPGAIDIPENGIDENCDGVDAVMSSSIESSNNFALKLSPNPTKNFLSISWNYPENLSIEIFDLNGRKLYDAMLESNSSFLIVDVSKFASGVYLLRAGDSAFRFEKNRFCVIK